MCGFACEPYLYVSIRLIRMRKLNYEHLYAPKRLIQAIHLMLCRRRDCPHSFSPEPGTGRADRTTFRDRRRAILSRADPHCRDPFTGVLQGCGRRASRFAWTREAQLGRHATGFWPNDIL